MVSLIGKAFGRYRIIERLGEGGMAAVFKALDTRLEREVALKIILPYQSHSEMFLKRFEREAHSLARLNHSNIVSIIDYGEESGAPFLVMTYLSGGTLKDRMKKQVYWQEAARLLAPIANALYYAHLSNIVHRDVKPANILMTESGEPMLSDFGIAKILETKDLTHLTGTGTVGTPDYMSPEQGRAEDLDGRSDIYSLGVVFYEMVTGRKPFKADTPISLVMKHVSDPLPHPSLYIRDLPAVVEQVIFKVMAKDPADRYPHMLDFARVLEQFARGGMAQLDISRPVDHKATVFAEPEPRPQTKPMEPSAYSLPLPKPIIKIPGAEQAGEKWQPDSTLRKAETQLDAFGSGAVPKPTRPLHRKPWVWVPAVLIFLGGFLAVVYFGARSRINALMPTIGDEEQPVEEVAMLPTETPGVETVPSPVDGMALLFIPAGDFLMGSADSTLEASGSEKPQHTVYLDAFYIDRYEVTNQMFTACVADGACKPPAGVAVNTRSQPYGNADYMDHPVVYISWEQAFAYCEWAGRRLPTEAEWEKAARGDEGLYYPWGTGEPDDTLANFSGVMGDTVVVGSYPDGASPYGVMDMAGNVREWVVDWYAADYYASGPEDNPQGPSDGQYRVLRGGSWENGTRFLRATSRYKAPANAQVDNIGFRCAVSADDFRE